MWVVCKRQKREDISYKRKFQCNGNFSNLVKKLKPESFARKRKLRPVLTEEKTDETVKKQKIIYCIIHDEKYICDIYECSGIKNEYKVDTMPYII